MLYGVGARLDEKPELLFLLRHVNHQDLVSAAGTMAALTKTKTKAVMPTLSSADVGDVFGIEMEPRAAANKVLVKHLPATQRKQKKTEKKRLVPKRVGQKPRKAIVTKGQHP